MKRQLLFLATILVTIATTSTVYSQAPESIHYQAVARDNAGALLANQVLDVRFSILENGIVVYEELHSTTTNNFGLFSLSVGAGVGISGDFTTIDWPNGIHQLKVEADPGTGFVNLGTSQLVSVPYSLYAKEAGAVSGLTMDGLSDVNASSPASNQVLKWNGLAWVPATDNIDDADSDPSNELQVLSLSGTNLTLSNGGGSVLLPSGGTYTGGTGINITGSNVINNTGDTDASDDITNSTSAGGDLGGTYPAPTVRGLRGNLVANTVPSNNQVLKFSAGQWTPSTDNVNDADSDPTNETQLLSISGNNLSLSNGGGSVSLPGGNTYTGGTGINITGSNVINNTGDTDASDDITNSTSAGGDLGGTYPAPTVRGLRGNLVANTVPSNNQVLKFSAGQWTPSTDNVNDADSDPTNETQLLSISGNNLSLSNGGGSVSLPGGNTYTGGTGINITGSNVINNTGDTNAGDDITTGTSAGGDLNGTYPSPIVKGLRGNPVANIAPSVNQVLKWNGSQWAPANDNSGSSVWQLNGVDAYYNGGDVGIGTTNPSGKFEVNQNSSLSDPHIWLHENGNDYARLNFDNNNGSNYWTIAAYIASNHKNDRLNFWNGTGGDVMTITGDGEVGIGVGISPKVPFHVGNGRRVLFGIDTLGNGDKLMFLPDLHAFRVGTVATGAASTYWNRDSIGLYSFASGLNTRAQGFGATAMGRDTEATNSYAFASGFFSNADGQYSTAMGFNTDAFALGSTALGYSTDAEANYSFAAGYFAEAQAIYSVAIGNAVRAQSYASMAVGRYNVGGGSATSWISSDPIFEIGIGTGPSTRANAMTVRKNGNIGIGTTFPGARLHVASGELRIGSLEELSDGGSFIMQVNSHFAPLTNGNRNLGNSSFRWNTVYATNGTINTSDRRDKESIQALNYGLAEVLAMKPVSFQWREHPEQGTKLGLIAQDLQQIVPEVVQDQDWVTDEATGEDRQQKAARLGVYYSDLIPVLIKATQEQQEKIDLLEKKLDEQQKLIEQLLKKSN